MKEAYNNLLTHNNKKKSEHTDSMNNDPCTYTEELQINKKKVKLTLEFPHTVDPRDAARFEHMLKEIYLNKIKKSSLQVSLHAVPYPSPRGKEENDHE